MIKIRIIANNPSNGATYNALFIIYTLIAIYNTKKLNDYLENVFGHVYAQIPKPRWKSKIIGRIFIIKELRS